MATKAQMYAQMADHAAVQLTSSWNEWMRFLDTASRLYKYPFHDQLMIYAQRPDATACAEYDLWNDKMGRYVRRGSKGIALVDDSGDRTRLRYVFDISDTGTREHSRTPWLWKMEERHIDSISAMLENRYEVGGDDLGGQLTEIARRLAGEYWADNGRDFLYIVDDSFLEEYDELNIEVQFKAAATVSIAYSLMSRCGLAPEQYFTHEDFMPVFDFNTPATVGALGTAVSQINQQVLRQIGVTILNAERQAAQERRTEHEEQSDLQPERGLSDSRPATDRTARNAPGQVRQDAENLLEGTPAHPLQPSADEREAVPAPVGDRPDREQPVGAADAGIGAGGGRDGGTESPRHDAVGGPDEQLQGPGGGDSAGGTYQQLTLNLFLSEAEQIQNIDEAENVKASSAFSFAQKDIDHTEPPQPALEELLEQYKPVVTAAIMENTAYRNACGHTDHENAVIEGNAAVRRAVLDSGDIQLIKQYSDIPDFRHRLHQEVVDETYPQLHELLRPLSQDDIDEALRAWNGDMDSKRAVVRYMEDHARDKDTAAWLSQEYGGPENKNLFIVRAGSPETIELPWPKVQRRIAQLIKENRFFTEAERENLDDIDPIAIRENLAQRGIVNGQVTEPEKLDNDPFIQQVMADVEQLTEDKPRFSVVMTSDAFPDPEDAFAVWDNQTNDYYTASDGTVRTFSREEAAEQFLTGLEPQEVNANRQEEPAQETAGATPAADEPGTLPRDPLASAYGVGDFVFLEDTEYRITDLQRGYVQLNDPALSYPIYRTESKEQFERAIRQDPRNSAITDFLPVDLEQFSPDLREVLTGEGGLLDAGAKEDIEALLRSGAGNPAIAQHLSQRFAGTVETMQLETGDTADYRTSANGMEVEILREDETVLAAMYESWEPLAAALRALYQQELDGFSHEPAQPEEQLAEEQRDFEKPTAPEPEPQITVTPVTRYPGEQNHLPYDIEIHTLHFDEPEPTPPQPTVGNFRITDIHLGEGGPKAKFRANMDAINLLKELEFENRQATPEEQETLSRYVGWGGLADAFDESKPAWAKEFAELYATLSPEEYEAAKGTTLNAHYTSPTVIQAIYEAVGKMGFQNGNILEPSCGVGNFFGMLPDSMAGSRLYGVELDSITGRIAKQLYPKADITIAGFQTTDRRDFYDIAVGNVPFGQYSVNDRAYNKLNFNIHNYFFAKSLDQVRPGGVVAFVTSRYTMDSKDSTVRRYLAQRAELLGAIRLPNNAFRANAGTEVVSDIIFLQKRDRPIDITPDWTQTGQIEDDFTINRYFLDHPEMVLGRQEPKSTGHGMDYTVNPIEGLELSDQLHDAIKYIRGTYQEAELPELGEGEEIDTSIPADPDVKNYSYTVVDGAVYYRENSRMVRPDLNATVEARIKGLVELRDCVQNLIAQQMDSFVSDAAIRETQAELNRLYDAFSAKYGLINDRGNRLAFADDSSYYLLCALEVIDDEGQLKQKADMFTKRTIKPHQAVTAVDTASEALAVSIAEKAEVDMAYMAELSGKTQEELALELRGVIFRLPGPLAEGKRPIM
jgi:adenine-specific DNA methylase